MHTAEGTIVQMYLLYNLTDKSTVSGPSPVINAKDVLSHYLTVWEADETGIGSFAQP